MAVQLEAGATAPPAANETLAAIPCFLVNNLTKNTEEQCKFIMDNDCLEDEATIDYVHLVYCELGLEMRHAAISLIVFLVIVLFLNLSAVADEFLCPSLLAVAKSLRMSDSLAGVTLLAFGNGCPDIFASLAAASSNRPELIVGELLGAGIFCTSIVAGLIFIHSDFKLASRPVLRDATFYLLAVYLIWLYCWNEEITFYGSLAFIVIYVIYLVVALSGQAIHSRLRGDYPIADAQLQNNLDDKKPEDEKNWFKWREESLRRRKQKLADEAASASCDDVEKRVLTRDSQVVYLNADQARKRSATNDNNTKASGETSKDLQLCSIVSSPSRCYCSATAANGGLSNKAFVMDNDGSSVRREQNSPQKQIVPPKLTLNEQLLVDKARAGPSEWDEFRRKLNPIDAQNWNQMRLTSKLINVLRAPILFVTILTVPVVDNEKQDLNWNRLLNTLHCVTIPSVVVFNSKWLPDDDLSVGLGLEIPAKALVVLPSFALALLVYRTSSAREPPRYHAVFAYFGFLMSVLWVYFLATEIISLLKTFGIIFGMSDTAIGLGVLAWGNSLGDIVANLSLAEAGYPRMALGASIGAPLLNLLLGFGLAFSVYLKPGESTAIKYSPTISLLCSTLAAILCSLMLSTMAPPDKSKRYFGFLLIACYAVYFSLAVCLECGLLRF